MGFWRRERNTDSPQDDQVAPAPTPEPETVRTARDLPVSPPSSSTDAGSGRPADPPEDKEDVPLRESMTVFSHLGGDSSPEVASIRKHLPRQHGTTRADFIDYSRERY